MGSCHARSLLPKLEGRRLKPPIRHLSKFWFGRAPLFSGFWCVTENARKASRTTHWPIERMKDPYDLQFLRETFVLQEDGTLVWTTRPRHHFKNDHGMNIFNAKSAGKPVGVSRCLKGYQTIPISYYGQPKRRRLSVSRVIYSLAHNVQLTPDLVIDHLDGNVSNNHPDNLRAVPSAHNNRNAVHRPGKSGFVGVRQRGDGWYYAQIGCQKRGEFKQLGRYRTAEEAYAAYFGAGVALGYTLRHLRAGCPAHHTPPL